MVVNKEIYLNGDYIVVSGSKYISNKFGHNARVVVEDTADVVLGGDWLGDYPKKHNYKRLPIIVNFLSRMSMRGIHDFKNEIVVYGKCYPTDQRSNYFGLSELFLISELSLVYDIKELKRLIKLNKIKIKTL
tara:strand:- start:2672 stop:3067 length:396 start_codon:yes stop_codon:yes gene_type:complete